MSSPRVDDVDRHRARGWPGPAQLGPCRIGSRLPGRPSGWPNRVVKTAQPASSVAPMAARRGGGCEGDGVAGGRTAATAERLGQLQLGGDAADCVAVHVGDAGGGPVLVLGLFVGEELAGAAARPHRPGVGRAVGPKVARLPVVVGEPGGVLVEPAVAWRSWMAAATDGAGRRARARSTRRARRCEPMHARTGAGRGRRGTSVSTPRTTAASVTSSSTAAAAATTRTSTSKPAIAAARTNRWVAGGSRSTRSPTDWRTDIGTRAGPSSSRPSAVR